MKSLPIVLGLALAGLGFAQEAPKKLLRKAPPKVAANAAAVNRAEAKKVLDKAAEYLGRSVKITIAPSSIKPGNGAVSRSEVVTEFARLSAAVGPKVKLTPIPVKFDASRLRLSATAKPALIKLVRLGAVAPYGPLATNKHESLTVEEFGDALGFFLARMSEITHMPSRQWSPMLQD